MSGQHLAAILPSQGSALQVAHRPTPTPGPNEVLVEVKSIALNPIDWKQRDSGFALAHYPAIIGSDIAGTIVSRGSSVPTDALKEGTRVAAFAPCFYKQGLPDYGALQKRVLVPAENVVPLPQGISFNEGSLLPMAVGTAWAGWYSIGILRDTSLTAADNKGILVWGGASSVGSAAIQTAKLDILHVPEIARQTSPGKHTDPKFSDRMGFTVYATASEKHHEYLKGLGASKVFDYKSEHVVDSIVKAAKQDGVTFQTGFDAVGALKSSIEILQKLKGEGTAKLASAVPLSEDSPRGEGVEVNFVAAPTEEKERSDLSHFIYRVWLKEKLEKGEFVPSPKIQVIEGGLEAAQKGLDELKNGVSGMKLVLEV